MPTIRRRNQQDTTLRNLRATKKRLVALERKFAELTRRLKSRR